jgi:hypothetical protein
MTTIAGIVTVILASACIGALVTYVGVERHHERLDHPKEKP